MQSMSHQRRVANLLLLATVAASISDLLLDLQVAWSLASNLGSVLAPATVLASSLLFRAAMSVVVGGIVDRYAPRTTMLLGLIGSLLLLLAFLAFVPIILTNVLAAVVFVLANDFCQSIFRRSSLIMASRSLRTEVFIKFQARAGVAGRLVGTAGLLSSGVLIAFVSVSVVVMIVAFGYMCAAVACFFATPGATRDAGEPRERLTLVGDLRLVGSMLMRSRFLRGFTLVLFVANLAYGFVPQLLPLALSIDESVQSLTMIRAGIAVGEIIGLVIVERFSRHVGRLFRLSMIGGGASVVLATAGVPMGLVVGAFLLYGLFDALSQPLFSYAVKQIDEEHRARVLGGIDAIVLLSPSVGLFIGSWLAEGGVLLSGVFVCLIFVVCLLIVHRNPVLSSPKLERE